MRIAAVLSVLLALPALAANLPEPEKKPRLVINDLIALRVAPEEAQAITDAVVTYLSARGLFEVLGTRDIQTILGAERQKQLLGACGEDSLACSVDLSKLVAARFVLSGQLAKVGSAYQLTLQLVDTERAQTASRSSKLANSLEEVRGLVPYAASEATGSPLPPPPSRVLPITLIGAGGATLLSGGVVGLLALSKETQLNEELCPSGPQKDGRCDGVNLRDRTFYVQQQDSLVVQKIIGVSLMAAGAVMMGLGLWLLPPDDARTRISARVLPTTNGFVLAGGF
jgi:TolB-like protein